MEGDVRREQPVRAHDDVHGPHLELLNRLALLGGRAEAAEHPHLHRVLPEPLAEAVEVLMREHRRRAEHRDLLAVEHRFERRADRDLRLAEADVAADQAVGRPRKLHVALDVRDRLELPVGLLEAEGGLQLAHPR